MDDVKPSQGFPLQRHLQDVLLVCLGGALALVLCLAVIAVVRTQPESTAQESSSSKVGDSIFFCDNVTCVEHSRRLLGYADWSRPPCRDFWAHACGGRIREVPQRADYFDASSAAMLNAVLDFERIARRMDLAYTDRAEKFAVLFYYSCVQRTFLDGWTSREFDMGRFFDQDLSQTDDDGSAATDVNDAIVALARRFWFFPFVTVKVLPRKGIGRVFDAHLFPPELSGTPEMFRVDQFRQDYIAAYRALTDTLKLRIPLAEADVAFDFEKALSESLVAHAVEAAYAKWASLEDLSQGFDITRLLKEVFSLETSEVVLRSPTLQEYFVKFASYFQTRRIILNNFAFRLLQYFILFFDHGDPGLKPFVNFVSRYRFGLLEPITPRLYCLPFLERYLEPIYMEILRRSQSSELNSIRNQMGRSYDFINHRTLEAGATRKSLVQRSSDQSFLSKEDVSTYVNMMAEAGRTFRFFMPINSEGYLRRRLTLYLGLPGFDDARPLQNLVVLTSKLRQFYKMIHGALEPGEFVWEGGIFRGEPYYEPYTDKIYFPFAFSRAPFYHNSADILAHGYPSYGLVLVSAAIRRVILTGSANRSTFTYGETMKPFTEATRVHLQQRLQCIERQLRRETLPVAQALEVVTDQAAVQFVQMTYTYALNHFQLSLKYDVRLRDLASLSEQEIFYLTVVQGRCGALDMKSYREHGGVLGRRDPIAAVNAPLWNVPNFLKTFNCPADTGMGKYQRSPCRGLFDTLEPSGSRQ